MRCAVLRCAILHSAMLCYATQHNATSCCAMLCFVMLCYMLSCALLCCVHDVKASSQPLHYPLAGGLTLNFLTMNLLPMKLCLLKRGKKVVRNRKSIDLTCSLESARALVQAV